MKFLRLNIFPLFLLVVITISVIGSLIVQVSFQINKQYIVEELCVQKDEVVNTCQGQCHLKKQLKNVEQSNDDDSKNNERIETFSFVWFFEAVKTEAEEEEKIN